MKQEAILLNRPEDYKRLGINPNQVEPWEDGVRDTSAPNHFEWWYFDSILDDGTKVVVQFLSKNGRTFASDKFHPTIFFKVTLPDGRQIDKEYHLKAEEIHWEKNACDVQFGPHFFKGDLQHYQIHMQLQDGMAADLTLYSTGKPYRPGTSYFQFGSEDKYYTWLCVVPRGKVTGSLTVDGQARNVSGSGYHDHQWGSINFHKYWNYWIWARQGFDDYSMLLFDFFTNEEYGYQRFPIIFIQDEHGNLNKTCYNGLFRVNNSGEFNSPFGNYRNPNIVNAPTLRAVNSYLNTATVHLSSTDYAEVLKTLPKGTFVYLDPPYDPVSDTSSFTGYSKGGFTRNDQIRLRECCDDLNARGLKFMLSNSATDFIKEQYSAYHITVVQAKRAVNSDSTKRGEVDEVVVRNYE